MGFIEDKRFRQYQARCLFFDRFDGVSSSGFTSLNVSFNVGDKEDNVRRNLDIVKKLSSARKLGLLNQVHSDKIIAYDENIYDADGFYTRKEGVFLGIRFADCVPIILMDTKERIIMAVHAGWRGTFLNIVKKGVRILKEMGAKPEDIIVSIGPHICSRCYRVKDDVASKFDDKFILKKDDNLYLNLEKANIAQLESEGIKRENIKTVGVCTYENKAFFSYRRDKICGRNIGGIILK